MTETSVIIINDNKSLGQFSIWSAILALSGWFVAIALALFIAAGTFRWVAGWCFLILYGGFLLLSSAFGCSGAIRVWFKNA